MYAIVDIETTGGNAKTGAITEIAIVIHDGINVIEQYQTLINPRVSIPPFITTLTGIDDEMVSVAPFFEDIAPKLIELLSGVVFVAHNVNFDYSFILENLKKVGLIWEAPKLCTVRLSRKIFPGYQSYSLGKICQSLGIPVKDRHRALGDALATTTLFCLLLQHDKDKTVQKMLKKGSRESYLPMNLPKADIDLLPDEPGVYYFHNQQGKIIYVGKAKALKKRVISHFSNNSTSAKKQELIRNVCHISFNLTGSEFAAEIIESIEIRQHWPIFNLSQKKPEFPFGLFLYEDMLGRNRLAIGNVKKYSSSIYHFHVLTEGYQLLWRMVKTHQLCPKLCFLQTEGDCVGVQEGYCKGVCCNNESIDTYNVRVKTAIEALLDILPSFGLVEQGRKEQEKMYMLVENGKFYGYGFLPSETKINNKEHLKELLQPAPENEFIRSLVLRYAEINPSQKINFTNDNN
jgi:DNA polymerase-3 subunit epsilon